MKKSEQSIPLAQLSELTPGKLLSIEQQGLRFLIVTTEQDIFVIEDRCGHFGVSLKNGSVENNQIRCAVHGARFDLHSGELLNDLFESCDPIKVFLWRKNNGWLEVLL